jgi:hypothetical protein
MQISRSHARSCCFTLGDLKSGMHPTLKLCAASNQILSLVNVSRYISTLFFAWGKLLPLTVSTTLFEQLYARDRRLVCPFPNQRGSGSILRRSIPRTNVPDRHDICWANSSKMVTHRIDWLDSWFWFSWECSYSFSYRYDILFPWDQELAAFVSISLFPGVGWLSVLWPLD